jgi:hypothetical protein
MASVSIRINSRQNLNCGLLLNYSGNLSCFLVIENIGRLLFIRKKKIGRCIFITLKAAIE